MARRTSCIPVFLLLLMAPVHLALGDVTASFRYPLSNFSGPVKSQWARLAVDQERGEVYALNRRAHDVRIFNSTGMEVHTFAEGFGFAADIAVGDDGDLFILTTGYQSSAVHLLDYRGEHVAEITPRDVPPEFSEYTADRLIYSQGSLYLINSDSLIVIVLDTDGSFRKGYDLGGILMRVLAEDERVKESIRKTDWEEKKLEYISLSGFHVDEQGNLLFTIPVLFAAYRLSSDGELRQFGRPGSAPGKFGVTAGIVTDDRGYIYVADRLRSVVLVFDPDFRFQTEFGYRGDGPSNLIVPDDLAVDAEGNVYVAQAANRGVSVFRVAHEDTSLPLDAEPSVPSIRDTTSEDSGKHGPTVEELYLPDRLEFPVDQDGDVTRIDSETNGRAVEESESNYLENRRNEED